MCGFIRGGGHAWFYLGGHAWFHLGGMRGFIWGGMRGFIWGACVVLLGGMRGFIWGGHVWFYWGGMHGFIWGACMVLSGGAACVVLSGGVRGFSSFFGYNEIRSMSGRYASYWNAFLFIPAVHLNWLHFFTNSKFWDTRWWIQDIRD